MSHIETYMDQQKAIDMRDHYNHNQHKRAVLFQLPGTPVKNYGGGTYGDLFNANIPSTVWMLVVED